MAAIKP